MTPAIGLPIAYLIGSFPTAYLAGRLLAGTDLRTVGSGNLGATNVFRALGWRAALAVFLVDMAKGAVPVWFLPRMLGSLLRGSDPFLWWSLAFGALAILGHSRPVFLLWKGGGKGVATAGGVFFALAPLAVASVVALLALVIWATGYVSLGSLAAAVALPILLWFDVGRTPVFWSSLATAAFVFWTHRANIRRLRAGTEHRFGTRKEDVA